MILRTGESNQWSTSSKKIGGINITPRMLAAAVATPLEVADFNGLAVSIKVQLERTLTNGKKITPVIFSSNCTVAVVDTALCTGSMQFCTKASENLPVEVLLAQGVATQEIGILPLKLQWGCIDLRGQDRLVVTMTSSTDMWSANVDGASSWIEVNWFEVDGVEAGIPIIDVLSVAPGENNSTYNIGDGVTSVNFINTDKATALTADQIIEQSNVVTQRYATNDNYNELRSKNAQLMSGFDYLLLGQNAVLMKAQNGLPANNVGVELQFVSGNVNGGKNYVVGRKLISSPDLWNSAMAKLEGIKAQNQAAITRANA